MINDDGNLQQCFADMTRIRTSSVSSNQFSDRDRPHATEAAEPRYSLKPISAPTKLKLPKALFRSHDPIKYGNYLYFGIPINFYDASLAPKCKKKAKANGRRPVMRAEFPTTPIQQQLSRNWLKTRMTLKQLKEFIDNNVRRLPELDRPRSVDQLSHKKQKTSYAGAQLFKANDGTDLMVIQALCADFVTPDSPQSNAPPCMTSRNRCQSCHDPNEQPQTMFNLMSPDSQEVAFINWNQTGFFNSRSGVSGVQRQSGVSLQRPVPRRFANPNVQLDGNRLQGLAHPTTTGFQFLPNRSSSSMPQYPIAILQISDQFQIFQMQLGYYFVNLQVNLPSTKANVYLLDETMTTDISLGVYRDNDSSLLGTICLTVVSPYSDILNVSSMPAHNVPELAGHAISVQLTRLPVVYAHFKANVIEGMPPSDFHNDMENIRRQILATREQWFVTSGPSSHFLESFNRAYNAWQSKYNNNRQVESSRQSTVPVVTYNTCSPSVSPELVNRTRCSTSHSYDCAHDTSSNSFEFCTQLETSYEEDDQPQVADDGSPVYCELVNVR